MTWMQPRLLAAMACSLLLHALPFLAGLTKPPAPVRSPLPLEALLLPPPAPAQPPMLLPEAPEAPRLAPRPPRPERSPPAPTPAPGGWTAEAQRQMQDLHKRGLLYPLEAVAQGIEGEALVLFVLDEAGTVVAARIERSSGHRILDEAALRAIHTLRSLPADAPREAVYPVRFRLY